jgi:hypothetical protein
MAPTVGFEPAPVRINSALPYLLGDVGMVARTRLELVFPG